GSGGDTCAGRGDRPGRRGRARSGRRCPPLPCLLPGIAAAVELRRPATAAGGGAGGPPAGPRPPACARAAGGRGLGDGAAAAVRLVSVVVRRAYGLGAQAMTGGDFHAPVLNVAWPTGEFGAMGVEGAVRLAMRKELEAIEDQEARETRVSELVGAVMAQAGAL